MKVSGVGINKSSQCWAVLGGFTHDAPSVPGRDSPKIPQGQEIKQKRHLGEQQGQGKGKGKIRKKMCDTHWSQGESWQGLNMVRLNNHVPLCASTSAKTQPKEFIAHSPGQQNLVFFEILLLLRTRRIQKAEKHWITDIAQVTQDKEKRLQLELAAVISHSVH